MHVHRALVFSYPELFLTQPVSNYGLYSVHCTVQDCRMVKDTRKLSVFLFLKSRMWFCFFFQVESGSGQKSTRTANRLPVLKLFYIINFWILYAGVDHSLMVAHGPFVVLNHSSLLCSTFGIPSFYILSHPKDMHCYRRQSTLLSSLISPDFALESGNKNDSALSAEW